MYGSRSLRKRAGSVSLTWRGDETVAKKVGDRLYICGFTFINF